MDPSIAPGEKDEITPNDLLALEVMGWTIGSGSATPYSWILPSSARAPGKGGAFYTTSLSIGNRGSAEARYTMKFLGTRRRRNRRARVGRVRPRLEPVRHLRGRSRLGLQHSHRRPTARSRSSRPSPRSPSSARRRRRTPRSPTAPSDSRSRPSAATDLIPSGVIRSIVGIREDTSFRTNLILANAGTSPVTIDGTLFSTVGNLPRRARPGRCRRSA